MLVFALQWISHHWEILIILLPQFQLTLYQTQKGMSCNTAWLVTVLELIGMVFLTIWQMFKWANIFKLGASAAASELCKWVQVGTEIYIPHWIVIYITSQKVGSLDVWQISISVVNKGKSGISIQRLKSVVFCIW